jgi:hypothetical protein
LKDATVKMQNQIAAASAAATTTYHIFVPYIEKVKIINDILGL